MSNLKNKDNRRKWKRPKKQEVSLLKEEFTEELTEAMPIMKKRRKSKREDWMNI